MAKKDNTPKSKKVKTKDPPANNAPPAKAKILFGSVFVLLIAYIFYQHPEYFSLLKPKSVGMFSTFFYLP
jgi:hypothetical protein